MLKILAQCPVLPPSQNLLASFTCMGCCFTLTSS